MWSLKRIQNIFSCLALLISLASFSGFTSISFNYEKPQTELFVSKYKNNHSTDKQCKSFARNFQKVICNQYIVFNFKSLLNIRALNFNITLKSQKETILQFENYNNLLEQNLIAQTHTIKSKSVFIE